MHKKYTDESIVHHIMIEKGDDVAMHEGQARVEGCVMRCTALSSSSHQVALLRPTCILLDLPCVRQCEQHVRL
eukprot:3936-Heterococcus_DN1.PRE.7